MSGKFRESARRPNVVVILSDDQGYGDLSCHGNPILKTPRLDRLQRESVRFTDFHVAPMCTPTRGQLLTGRDSLPAKSTHVAYGRVAMRAGMPTMADYFRENGYRTGHFGKWHLGDNYPFRPEDRGFDETVWFPNAGISSSSDHWDNDYFDDVYIHNATPQQYTGYCTDVFFGEAAKWIESCHRDAQPFFAYIATNADHIPLFAPEKYREPYAHVSDVFVRSFYAMVSNFDENVGRLDDFLATLGVRDDTIFIFLTDNGACLGAEVYNAGMRGTKISYYEGGHRVPCFLRWPGAGLAARDIEDTAHCQDILPTLIDLCGLQISQPPVFDGVTLNPPMRDAEARLPDRMLVVKYANPTVRDQNAVLWNKWRLVNLTELFNVESDPGQRDDVAGRFPEVVRRMRDHYDRWWDGQDPSVFEYERIVLGSDAERETALSSVDWASGESFMFQSQIRALRGHEGQELRGEMSGKWNLFVERPGEYALELRRWPREADTPIRGAARDFDPFDKTFIGIEKVPTSDKEFGFTEHEKRVTLFAGSQLTSRALPIRKAAVQFGESHMEEEVADQDKAVTFTCRLPQGETTLQTWFYDEAGELIVGAFYVYVSFQRE